MRELFTFCNAWRTASVNGGFRVESVVNIRHFPNQVFASPSLSLSSTSGRIRTSRIVTALS
jgi:hypothetical protein